MFHQLNERAVGKRIASDHLHGVGGFVVQIQADLDLDRVLDDVVVGADEAVLADDEAGPGRTRDLFPAPPPAATLLAVIVTLPLPLPLPLPLAAARAAEEAAEEVVAASEQTFEVLGLRLHL